MNADMHLPIAAAAAANQAEVPLVVDVDGTLIRTDLLHEATLQFLAQRPSGILRLPSWIAGGKVVLKAKLADSVDPGIGSVPLREEVLVLIRDAQAAGRPVYLASASDHRYVAALADRIGGLAGIFATDGTINLGGANKANRLVGAFGEGGFDYVGDARVDFPVWRAARRQLYVAHDAGFSARVRRAFPEAEQVATARPKLRSYLRGLRMYQWAKNLLVFLPLISGHQFSIGAISAALIALLSFSFAASSAYIVNDLLDLPGDRDHPRKRTRPFAAGEVPITHGLVMAIGLMALSVTLALMLPPRFLLVLASYASATLAYSLFLKRKVLVDVILLGGLYTVRVLGGLAAVGSHSTPWLLMFCLFLFLCLAIVKRCSELVTRRNSGRGEIIGRGYRIADLAVLFPFGAAAGYGAVFVVTLYLSSAEVMALYTYPERLWLLCPLLLYWISRVLILSNRGEMHDDPVIFAMRDRISWVTAALILGVIAISM